MGESQEVAVIYMGGCKQCQAGSRRGEQEEHMPQSRTDMGSNPSSAPTGCVT